ncbi:hypothetical protein AGMMS49573_07430 [Endomicrobiia bacterium]|nr:hypothetical protein AGMMS49573_07430 [Endomicrobiia bacterium]
MNIVRGTNINEMLSKELIDALTRMSLEGILYLGYPIISIDDEANSCDAMLLSEKYGIIIFDYNNRNFSKGIDIENAHDKLYLALKSKLTKHVELTKKEGRERLLDVPIIIILFSPSKPKDLDDFPVDFATKENLEEKILSLEKNLDKKYLIPLKAAIDSVKTFKPRKKRSSVTKECSKGGILKIIEKEIANLDRWQQKAALETPDAPQRIRGLAGSGKTVVLARKAAHLHGQHPDWNIAVTYNTRSLCQQIKELVRRFYYDQCEDEPNWEKIKIIPAWGGGRSEGIYSQVANYYNIQPVTFSEAKSLYGNNNALKGICDELLKKITSIGEKEPIYDVLLIDEAQDLPVSFFKIVYEIVNDPKRIIWAYDELQNLGEYQMAPPDQLFGVNESGLPKVVLSDLPDTPRQDVILPICYRGTKYALTVAHALGFGIYRNKGLVQLFDDKGLWKDIGYATISGNFDSAGKEIRLKRKDDCSPNFFDKCKVSESAMRCITFKDKEEQYDWLLKDIKYNLENEEIEEDDILIILTDPLTVCDESRPVVKKLLEHNLKSHIVGITNDRDIIFVEKSIAISSIYRAKGNEAPLVYVLNSQSCFDGVELIKKRNILF